jgi:Domain of unknown function (DUF4276)
MIRVGLVGENPSDTTAIENLLAKENENVSFFPLLSGIMNGSMLDSQVMITMLRREVESEQPDIILFIRDVDAIKSDKDYAEKFEKRQAFYSKCKRVINQRKQLLPEDSLFLLNIYELEALILADIEMCIEYYNTPIELKNLPMQQPDPKDFLKEACKYKESDSPDIFKKLRISIVKENCPYFDEFMEKWNKAILFHQNEK